MKHLFCGFNVLLTKIYFFVITNYPALKMAAQAERLSLIYFCHDQKNRLFRGCPNNLALLPLGDSAEFEFDSCSSP